MKNFSVNLSITDMGIDYISIQGDCPFGRGFQRIEIDSLPCGKSKERAEQIAKILGCELTFSYTDHGFDVG